MKIVHLTTVHDPLIIRYITIIYSDFPVWKRLIDNTGSGICMKSRDDNGIKKAIEYLHTNKNTAEQIGANGRECVEKSYNWGNEALKLHRQYNEIAAKV